MNYSIYSQTTGQILRVINTDNINLQLGIGESFIEGSYNDSSYYIENNMPVEIPEKISPYAEFDYSTKVWVLNTKLAEQEAKSKRRQLLSASDWTQLPNGPLSSEQQTAWATYRQALRDITSQPGYPINVVWPTQP